MKVNVLARRGVKYYILLCTLFCTIFILSTSPTLAAWCVIDLGGENYQCYDSATYQGGDFQTFCNDAGGSYMGDSAEPSQCNMVCCCRETDDVALNPSPIAATACAVHHPEYLSVEVADDANVDCEAQCGLGSGSTGSGGKGTITGTVFNVETGEQVGLDAAKIEYPVGSAIAVKYTDAMGAYTLSNVPVGTFTVKASKTGCGSQQALVTLDQDGASTSADFTLDCSVGACTVEPVTDVTATPVRAEAKVLVTWTPSDCSETQGTIIYRCEGNACTGGDAIGYVTPTTGSFVDTTVEANTAYCYFPSPIQVRDDGSTAPVTPVLNGSAHCILPMNEYCLHHDVAGLECFNEDSYPASTPDSEYLRPPAPDGTYTIQPFIGSASCDDNNRVGTTNECPAGEFCSYDPSGAPTCRFAGNCEKCNGFFGWLVDLAARVMNTGVECEDLLGCVYDNAGYATNTFRSCGEITSCYDYGSQAACESGATSDTCGVSDGGCVWAPLPGLEETGKGVCVPRNPKSGEAPCWACDDLFGTCTAEYCMLLGDDCYYNEYTNPLYQDEPLGCLSSEQMACAYYDSAHDCTHASEPDDAMPTTVNPGTPSPFRPHYDVTYDLPDDITGVRTGGTHALTNETDDVFVFQKCAWVADFENAPDTNGYCVKDGNGLLATVPWFLDDTVVVDDCFERSGWAPPPGVGWGDCFHDVTAPKTTLPFPAGTYLDARQLRESTPLVTDETFGLLDPSEYTRACMVPAGETCYPNEYWENLVPETVGVGAYTIYYYSVDPAGNLEVVRSIDVLVDQDSGAYLVGAELVS